MKKLYFICLTLIVFASSQMVFSQNGNEIVSVRGEVSAINKNLGEYTKKTKDVSGISLEGAQAAFYASGKNLKKISAKIYGETYNAAADFYYKDEQLIFARYKINRYDTQIGLDKPPKVVKTEEKLFYLVDGKPIKLLVGKHNIKQASKQFEESKNEIIELSKKLREAF